jgi:hypothetical protein
MAIQNEPTRISTPFADAGTKNVIPETMAQPSATAAASWQAGFPTVCSLPLSAGGIPPARNDFNGIFNQITQTARFLQDGGVYEWDSDTDYGANRLVLGSDGLLYWSVAQSGPGVGGAQDPTADSAHAYWASPKVPTMPTNDLSGSIASTNWVDLWYDSKSLAADYYVDPVNGSDANSGTTPEKPVKTTNYVISLIKGTKNPIPLEINIHLANGVYNASLLNNVSGCKINFIGPSTSPNIAEFTRGEFSQSTTELRGRIRFRAYTPVNRSASLVFGNGAYINCHDLGSTQSAFRIYINGTVSVFAATSATLEFTGTNSFTTGTIELIEGGRMSLVGTLSVTNSGTVSGKRYSCRYCSGITGAGSTTFFPGDTNGTIDSTSYYE